MIPSANEDFKQMVNKVPEVTIYFWVIKILATTVGETAADYLNFNLNFGLAGTSWVMGGILAALLIAQMRARRYMPGLYWATVVMISIAGTLVTDTLTDTFGVPLTTSNMVFSLALAATFAIWYGFERTLSIHTIYSSRREGFYWLAILFTFALGTAAGDLVAESAGLGYGNSALMFGTLIAFVAAAHYLFRVNAIASFWVAYILTRPLGASFGDLLSQPVANGGFGLGVSATSGVFLAAILGLVLFLAFTRRDVTSSSSQE